jgi:hypothetical protein
MTFREKQLYHQVHPLKLGTDITASVVSTYYFWVHAFWPALAWMFLPPIIVSTVMLLTMDFTWIKESAVGRYLSWEMTPAMEALRLSGTIPMAVGAWYHQPWAIALGVLIVLFGWLRGLIFPPRRRAHALPPL